MPRSLGALVTLRPDQVNRPSAASMPIRLWKPIAIVSLAASADSLGSAPAPLVPYAPPAPRYFTQSGTASWYGPGFVGRETASGEIFDQDAMTAAHKTLPLGARVRVINLQNARAVEVRINDRGPYVGDRIIDLSYAAAKAIDMVGAGITDVLIEVLDPPMPSAVHVDSLRLPSAVHVDSLRLPSAMPVGSLRPPSALHVGPASGVATPRGRSSLVLSLAGPTCITLGATPMSRDEERNEHRLADSFSLSRGVVNVGPARSEPRNFR